MQMPDHYRFFRKLLRAGKNNDAIRIIIPTVISLAVSESGLFFDAAQAETIGSINKRRIAGKRLNTLIPFFIMA
jgi:hypothetical protein